MSTEYSFDETENSRVVRSTSLQSVDNEVDNNNSQSLLATETGGGAAVTPEETALITIVGRVIKRALEPLEKDLKDIKKQCVAQDKKMTAMAKKNDILEKLLKEMAARNQKGAESLDCLLSVDGCRQLKSMCFKNLDMKAKEANEVAMLTRFMERAKEEGWLMNPSDGAQKDIFHHYRDKRNYLKAQIRLRIFDDLSNKTPDEASELPRTVKFSRDHLGLSVLGDEHLLVLYNFAYSHLKYLNSRLPMTSQAEKRNQKLAVADPWAYAMGRVGADRVAKKDHSVIKERFVQLVNSVAAFEPL